MIKQSDFDAATRHAERAFDEVTEFPHGYFRDEAREMLRAAIGWIKQARDEWATKAAGQ